MLEGERNADAIQLTEELVIGADLDNPDAAVFRASHVVGTADGTSFVADAAMKRLQMFDRDGRYLRTLGREGQGPGEFSSISSMTIACDLLVIDDDDNDRFSVWTLSGENVRDYRKETALARTTRDIAGLMEETLLAKATTWNPDEQPVAKEILARFSLERTTLSTSR